MMDRGDVTNSYNSEAFIHLIVPWNEIYIDPRMM
jgi:hypothetical protein